MERPELTTFVGDRFFAVLRTFILQCPRCGAVYGTGRGFRAENVYNPRTQRFRCIECSFRAVLGIVAWPVKQSVRAARPEDCLPTPRQQLRITQQSLLGLWLEKRSNGLRAAKGGRDRVNAVGQEREEPDMGPAEPTGRLAAQALLRQKKAHRMVEGEQAPPRRKP